MNGWANNIGTSITATPIRMNSYATATQNIINTFFMCGDNASANQLQTQLNSVFASGQLPALINVFKLAFNAMTMNGTKSPYVQSTNDVGLANALLLVRANMEIMPNGTADTQNRIVAITNQLTALYFMAMHGGKTMAQYTTLLMAHPAYSGSVSSNSKW